VEASGPRYHPIITPLIYICQLPLHSYSRRIWTNQDRQPGRCHLPVHIRYTEPEMATKKRPTKPEPEEPERTYKTTGINLPADIWELLNRCAFERAKKYGGRPSVSALLVELVQRHRRELEKELGG